MRQTLAVAFTVLVVASALPLLAMDAAVPFQMQDARIHTSTNGEALTLPSQAAPVHVVKQFLAQHLAPTDTLQLTRQFRSETAGVTHVRMTQEIAGLQVYGSYVRAAVNDFGELVWMADTLTEVPASSLVRAQIGAQRALETALRELHPALGDFTRVDLQGNTTVFAGDFGFWRPPTVTRIAVPMTDGSLQEGFLVETWTDEDNLLHHTLVSGTGEILNIELRTNTDSYNIFPDHPGNSTQTIVAGPGSGNAESPLGWLDAGDHTSIFITGNNSHTYLDTNANNSPDSTRPDGSSPDVISDGNFLAVADLNSEPEDGVNPDVAVQNLFYLCNTIHDKLYSHGFVEAAGNFQDDNFGNGGNGGDPVLCEAQDGSGTNNANFATPSDGSSGRMQMFVWTQSSPKRDGDLDSDIPWHEYGHGLTWRMIGSMSGAMSGAIGEGNSDVLAILINQNDVMGEYSFNNPLGIRSESYTDYSRTYGDFSGSSVHFDGEIYAAIHWKLNELYAANGFTVDDHFDDMVGGMNFTPSGPDFEAMRDGILAQAPSSRDCLIWEAFAQFGVGVNASNDISCNFFGCSGSINEDFTVPAECDGGTGNTAPTVTISAPADGSSFDEGTSVTFSGTASDAEDGDLTSGLVWTSDLDGQIGTGGSFSTSTLSVGTHTVTASVTDSGGLSGSDSINVTIDAVGGGDPITLSTTGRKVRGRHNIDLTWSGATSTNVDVYRNGNLITTTANDGAFTDATDNRGNGTYQHQVCEAGTTVCSNIATPEF